MHKPTNNTRHITEPACSSTNPQQAPSTWPSLYIHMMTSTSRHNSTPGTLLPPRYQASPNQKLKRLTSTWSKPPASSCKRTQKTTEHNSQLIHFKQNSKPVTRPPPEYQAKPSWVIHTTLPPQAHHWALLIHKPTKNTNHNTRTTCMLMHQWTKSTKHIT